MKTYKIVGPETEGSIDVQDGDMIVYDVCKIADYGQLKYDRKKRAASARKNQVQVQTKEVKVRPKTDEHDMAVKTRATRKFLGEVTR